MDEIARLRGITRNPNPLDQENVGLDASDVYDIKITAMLRFRGQTLVEALARVVRWVERNPGARVTFLNCAEIDLGEDDVYDYSDPITGDIGWQCNLMLSGSAEDEDEYGG